MSSVNCRRYWDGGLPNEYMIILLHNINYLFVYFRNSAYGGLLVNVEKHTVVKYTSDIHKAMQSVNSNRFRALRCLNGNLYEMTFGKRIIKLETPVYLGLEILHRAKLQQLRMYYDFIGKFMVPRLYNLLGCDTDSLIIEYSRSTMDQCVRPELKDQYDRLLYRSCNKGGKPDDQAFLIRRCCLACTN